MLSDRLAHTEALGKLTGLLCVSPALQRLCWQKSGSEAFKVSFRPRCAPRAFRRVGHVRQRSGNELRCLFHAQSAVRRHCSMLSNRCWKDLE